MESVSGEITNPDSDEANEHAQIYYNEIRHFTTDVDKIVKNTGIARDYIATIKQYLFMAEHNLGDAGIRRFDPSFQIAESWRRLAFDPKNIKPHDITLLKHELEEIRLVYLGQPQGIAHVNASRVYNYTKESSEYYQSLSKHGPTEQNDFDFISGGITKIPNVIDYSDGFMTH